MIGRSGERVSGISVLAARHDDDYICTTHNVSNVNNFVCLSSNAS